jgi:hypothetical protein
MPSYDEERDAHAPVEPCELQGRDLSPNEMYAACVAISGYVPLPLTDDHIELLPAVFRAVNDYGLTIDNRTYDCKALSLYRRLNCGLPSGNKQWEVRYDPLRRHRGEAWGLACRCSSSIRRQWNWPGPAGLRPQDGITPDSLRAAHRPCQTRLGEPHACRRSQNRGSGVIGA